MRGGKVKVAIIPLVFDTPSIGAVPWRFVAFLNLGSRLQGTFFIGSSGIVQISKSYNVGSYRYFWIFNQGHHCVPQPVMSSSFVC